VGRGFLGLELLGYFLGQCQKVTKAHEVQRLIYKSNPKIELENLSEENRLFFKY
jgi:hypothetical protein